MRTCLSHTAGTPAQRGPRCKCARPCSGPQSGPAQHGLQCHRSRRGHPGQGSPRTCRRLELGQRNIFLQSTGRIPRRRTQRSTFARRCTKAYHLPLTPAQALHTCHCPRGRCMPCIRRRFRLRSKILSGTLCTRRPRGLRRSRGQRSSPLCSTKENCQ
eukprot:2066774-Rhodomonas_salina.1